jgi:hypothetical protein
VFSQPVATTHASVVQAFPSSQDLVPPPAVQAPDAQVFTAVHVSPAHEAGTHDVPSVASLHSVVVFAVEHTRHASSGFACPSAKQVPAIRQ